MASTPAGDFVETLLSMAERPDDFTKDELAVQLRLAEQVLAAFLDPEERATIDGGKVDDKL